MTPRSIKDAAAKRAGFSSTTLAIRAEAVFSRGAEDLQTKVRDGSVTITAAYDQLPKRPKAKTAAEEPAADDAAFEDDVSPIAEPEQAAPAFADTFAPVVADDEEEEPQADDEELDEPEAGLFSAPDEDESNIGVHVSAVCGYLIRLAGVSYDDAIAWFDQTVDEMRASIGEPPDVEGEEGFDE